MAFKRSNCKSLVSSKREFFGSAYKFSKCVPFKEGSDYYVILLGLENGFYELDAKTGEVKFAINCEQYVNNYFAYKVLD